MEETKNRISWPYPVFRAFLAKDAMERAQQTIAENRLIGSLGMFLTSGYHRNRYQGHMPRINLRFFLYVNCYWHVRFFPSRSCSFCSSCSSSSPFFLLFLLFLLFNFYCFCFFPSSAFFFSFSLSIYLSCIMAMKASYVGFSFKRNLSNSKLMVRRTGKYGDMIIIKKASKLVSPFVPASRLYFALSLVELMNNLYFNT